MRSPGLSVEGSDSPSRRTSPLAVVSLVCGIVSWGVILFPAVLPIIVFALVALLAVIFGHRARGRIRQADGEVTGNRITMAGLILGYVQIVSSALVLALVIATA